MSRPVLLDLFAGIGGAAVGYHRAGFRVIGVDHIRRRDYPYRLMRADVMDVLGWDLSRFDAIHASPPCQRWASPTAKPELHPDFITPVRAVLAELGVPYVIENVPRAPLIQAVQLCGSSFGLRVRRHRRFESNVPLWGKACAHDGKPPVGVYGAHPEAKPYPRANGTARGMRARTIAEAQRALGITWADQWDELAEAIPPAYTEWIGRQLMYVRGLETL